MQSKAITDKTWFVVNGHLEVPVTPREAELVKQQVINGTETLELSDGTLMPGRNTMVMNAEKYEDYHHRKRGDWQCKWGTWHDRMTPSRDCTCAMQHQRSYQPPPEPEDTRTEEEKAESRKKLDQMRADLQKKLKGEGKEMSEKEVAERKKELEKQAEELSKRHTLDNPNKVE
jgi:hypothetical protein